MNKDLLSVMGRSVPTAKLTAVSMQTIIHTNTPVCTNPSSALPFLPLSTP